MRILLAAALFFPMSAMADTAESMFTCTFRGGDKVVQVYTVGELAGYAYGPQHGNPEMTLVQHALDVDLQPWSGIGRYESESVTFLNVDTTYTVWWSVDKMDMSGVAEGGITVAQGDNVLADLTCDQGSVETNTFYALHDLREDLGLRWCITSQTWAANCKG